MIDPKERYPRDVIVAAVKIAVEGFHDMFEKEDKLAAKALAEFDQMVMVLEAGAPICDDDSWDQAMISLSVILGSLILHAAVQELNTRHAQTKGD